MSGGAPDLSLVMCTKNRRDGALRTLDTVFTQTSPVPWEIVVVDNGSDDGTVAALRDRAGSAPVPMRVVVEERPGTSAARNRTLAEARGRLLVSVDDDVTVHPGSLEAHVAALEAPGVVATGGRVLPRLPESIPAWLRRATMSRNGGPFALYDYGPEDVDVDPEKRMLLPVGANMGLDRAAALAEGGFSARIGYGPTSAMPAEETHLIGAMRRRGGRVRYVAGAAVDHWIPEDRATVAYVLRWWQGYGRASVWLDGVPEASDLPARAARERRRIRSYGILSRITPGRERRLKHAVRQARARGRVEAFESLIEEAEASRSEGGGERHGERHEG